MKNVFTALILGIALTAAAFGQATSKGPRVAVIEFTPGPNAAGMTAEAKRQLQASIAFELTESDRFDVVDVRRTRAASQADLSEINGGNTTSAAVRVGKLLGVNYVLTGIVTTYDTKGSATLKTRLIDVATGKVKHSGETTQQSTSPMRTTGAAEMQTKVLKPAIEKLTAALTAVR